MVSQRTIPHGLHGDAGAVIARAAAPPHNGRMLPSPAPWPYPRWIAHRGGGDQAPENTLAAFRTAAARGWRMYECDAKLSADGVVYLLHDDTLDRTTSGQGPADALPWTALTALDAGAWHSPVFSGEPPAPLAAVATHCLALGHALNIEIKPMPGQAAATGAAVARAAQALWAPHPDALPPLLTSFQPDALAAAQAAAPALPRGLLLHTLWSGWEVAARSLGCVAIVAHHPLWDEALVKATAGWRRLAYTVNDEAEAARLWALGLDGLITDRIARLDPAAR